RRAPVRDAAALCPTLRSAMCVSPPCSMVTPTTREVFAARDTRASSVVIRSTRCIDERLHSLRVVNGLEVFGMEGGIHFLSRGLSRRYGPGGALWTVVCSLRSVEHKMPLLSRAELRRIVPQDIMTAGKAHDDGFRRVAAFMH